MEFKSKAMQSLEARRTAEWRQAQKLVMSYAEIVDTLEGKRGKNRALRQIDFKAIGDKYRTLLSQQNVQSYGRYNNGSVQTELAGTMVVQLTTVGSEGGYVATQIEMLTPEYMALLKDFMSALVKVVNG